MTRQVGFYLDIDCCTGCGTCVLACRDKNNLLLLRRRIRESESGGFSKHGDGYISDVFAFYLPISCNHCSNPQCVLACPAGAIQKREDDGLVILNREICTGCELCISACPYHAIRYDRETAKADKCDGCRVWSGGGEPECVAACPMRALDFGFISGLGRKYPEAARYECGETGSNLFISHHRRTK